MNIGHPSVYAATAGNFREMVLAVSTIPVEIAAEKAFFDKEPKRAALLHIAADLLALANKYYFFDNNIAAQNGDTGTWTYERRDMAVNAALVVLDIKNLVKHYEQFKALHIQELEEYDPFADPINEDEDESRVNAQQQLQISHLAYYWRVVALPCLKGLTALAVACTQEGVARRFEITQARNLAIAAHSFTKLLSEYASLEQSASTSKYKIILSAALMANAAWLVYEAKDYIDFLTPTPMEKVQGSCPVCCLDNEVIELNRLHCGHAYCTECLQGQIREAFKVRGTSAFHKIACPNSCKGCTDFLSRNEIAEVMKNDKDYRAMLIAFDEARRHRKAENSMTDEEVRTKGMKRCPNPQCRVPIEKGDMCPQTTCQCGHNFCWWCLGDYYNNHEQNGCHNRNYGQNPNIDQMWDYVRESLDTVPPY
ncbi:hypothetical protein IPF37_02580 [bacterium]|nr:MAG: hypothetical protein IPF37_02580 [bacterium]